MSTIQLMIICLTICYSIDSIANAIKYVKE